MDSASPLLTSGSLVDLADPVQRQTLVANQMTAYLESEHKVLDETVLAWMMEAFRRKVVKQIMSARDTRKGHDSCSMFSGPCARKAWYQFHGTVGEPILSRTILKFLMGDTIELDVVGIARLAGVELLDNNRDLFITGKDGTKVGVHPDGRIHVGAQVGGTDVFHEKDYNLECKSADTYSFDGWLRNGGPDDKFGYLTQASVEIAAWREAGYDVDSTCFVAVSTGSRQGSIAEWIIPYDQALVDGWHARRALARAESVPPIPFELDDETEYRSGKAIDAEAFSHGEAKPRVNAKGAVYGWDIPTGRKILPMICSYCAYKQQCHPGAEMEVKGGRPVWVVREAKGAYKEWCRDPALCQDKGTCPKDPTCGD